MNIQEAIKENTVIHCETESEAIRILKMAHELGYNWGSGRSFTNARNSWRVHECETCYYIIDGICGPVKYHKNRGYKIINSTEITGMKKYRLKKWYPSLAISWRTDDRYEYDADRRVMTNISNVKNGLAMPKEMVVKEQEIHPDFWEEVKQPLFVTEDGVECFDGDEYIAISYDFNKINMIARNIIDPYLFGAIKFKHKSNADEYIAWHKKKFSVNDLLLADVGITTSQLDKLQELAKKGVV